MTSFSRTFLKLLGLIIFCISVYSLFGTINAQAATINVNTTVDELDFTANTSCSWREATISITKQADFGGCIGGVYAVGQDDVINLPAGNYEMTRIEGPYSSSSVNIGSNFQIDTSLNYDTNLNFSTNKLIINGDTSGFSVINQTIPTAINLYIVDHELTINNITFRGGINGIKLEQALPVNLNSVTIENSSDTGINRTSSRPPP
jgi:hypothetical protein